MMSRTILPPTRATFNLAADCSRLWFPPESIAPSGYYQVAGGICWPLLVNGLFTGAVLIAGRLVDDGRIFVFEQREFSSIDHLYGPDREITLEGLASDFPRWWATYFMRRFYWFQTDEWHKTFRRRVRESPLIEPHPSMVQLHWSDEAHVSLVISDATAQGRLLFKGGGVLESQLDQFQADPDMGPFPAVHALGCLLTGLARKRFPSQESLHSLP